MKFLFSFCVTMMLLASRPLSAQLPDDTDTDAAPPPGSTVITSDELHSDQASHQSIFTGRVVVSGKDFRMTCQEMTVFFTKDNKVDHIVATGDVIITQPNRVTHCGHAVYTQDSDTFDLTEQPVILDHKSKVSGQEILIDRKTQKMTVQGGRSTVILQDQELGGPSTTSPTPTSPSPQ